MPVEHWREVTRHETRTLQQWVCTDPPKYRYLPGSGRTHPREWELEVQSYIRNGECFGETLVWGGFDQEGLVAIAVLRHYPRDDETFICALGRSYRTRGHGVGDELMTECLRLIDGGDPRVTASTATGRVHIQNAASKVLLSRHGFECLETSTDDLEFWVHILS